MQTCFHYKKKMCKMKFLNIYFVDISAPMKHFGMFIIHDRHPSIQQLAVLLEDNHRVFFKNETAVQVAVNPNETTLTTFIILR